jgi:hypothetical protein
LTKALRLIEPRLWEAAAIIEEDSADGYRRALECARRISLNHRIKLLYAGRRLARQTAQKNYFSIMNQLSLE